ncbi:heme ABC transporter [Saccharolobus solfataricus]|uniref:Heme ABC transporter n=1 Tax=Saccharolobus solfataricus TaxID=2287 RepID=A0A157T0R5_SACSO|nr:ATP-binding cassette domain-containing protein [Saccharolobus solfataricus]SAI84816.1 heme ABC transporter [Saccharolobus solfataricus]
MLKTNLFLPIKIQFFTFRTLSRNTGKNGAGKTTLLRTIAGILKPIRGEIKVNGKVAYISHSYGLP